MYSFTPQAATDIQQDHFATKAHPYTPYTNLIFFPNFVPSFLKYYSADFDILFANTARSSILSSYDSDTASAVTVASDIMFH